MDMTSSELHECDVHNARPNTSSSSHMIVQTTMKDLFELQQNTLHQVKSTIERQKSNYILKQQYEEIVNCLEYEKLEHTKTKLALAKETDRSAFLSDENNILRTCMQREKRQFESTIKTLQDKSTRGKKQSDFLHEQLSEMEGKIEKHKEIIQTKDSQIASLKQRLKIQKDNHKHALEEIDINKMQEEYMTKKLCESQKTTT